MKYLKKIFEADTDFDPNVPELSSLLGNWNIANLQSAIDEYNRLLAKDEVWNNFYSKIDLEFEKKLSDNKYPKLLNDICEFGENRLKEIKKEKEEDLQLVKDLVIDYLEDCKSFDPEEFKVRLVNLGLGKGWNYSSSGHEIELTLVFLKKCMEDRRDFDGHFRITENEIMDYWENLIDLFKVLKSNGFESNIRYYQPSGIEMKIIIQKRDEN
jgi:hypothetical protein